MYRVSGRKSLPERQYQIFLTPQTTRRRFPQSSSSHGVDMETISMPPTPGHSPGGSEAESTTSSRSDIISLNSEVGRRSKKYWHKRILRFRDDVNKVFSRVKERYNKRRSPRPIRKVEVLTDPDLGIEVTVKYCAPPLSRSSSKDKLKWTPSDASDVVSFDQPIQNMTQSLVMTGLSHGMFEAALVLPSPIPANLVVKVRESGRLSLYTRKHDVDDSHTLSIPYKFGEVQLPMYVDPNGLKVTLVEGRLVVRAPTKGSQGRRFSLSTGDLRSDIESHEGQKRAPRSLRGLRSLRLNSSHRSRSNTN